MGKARKLKLASTLLVSFNYIIRHMIDAFTWLCPSVRQALSSFQSILCTRSVYQRYLKTPRLNQAYRLMSVAQTKYQVKQSAASFSRISPGWHHEGLPLEGDQDIRNTTRRVNTTTWIIGVSAILCNSSRVRIDTIINHFCLSERITVVRTVRRRF